MVADSARAAATDLASIPNALDRMGAAYSNYSSSRAGGTASGSAPGNAASSSSPTVPVGRKNRESFNMRAARVSPGSEVKMFMNLRS